MELTSYYTTGGILLIKCEIVQPSKSTPFPSHSASHHNFQWICIYSLSDKEHELECISFWILSPFIFLFLAIFLSLFQYSPYFCVQAPNEQLSIETWTASDKRDSSDVSRSIRQLFRFDDDHRYKICLFIIVFPQKCEPSFWDWNREYESIFANCNRP